VGGAHAGPRRYGTGDLRTACGSGGLVARAEGEYPDA